MNTKEKNELMHQADIYNIYFNHMTQRNSRIWQMMKKCIHEELYGLEKDLHSKTTDTVFFTMQDTAYQELAVSHDTTRSSSLGL